MSEPLAPCVSRCVAEELEREYRMGPELVRVLRGVSLTVNAGESVAIIGASGVGKSTLLHLLGTLDRPTAGRVIFDGEDVFTRTDAALARLRRTEVGFVFQFYNLLGEMTALENAMLPALLQRRQRAGGARPGARRPCTRSGSATGRRIGPASCPAASSSAWRSPAPWWAGRA